MIINNKLTPDGTNDKLFEQCAVETEISGKLASLFEESGYRKVRTPGLEFLSSFAASTSFYPPEEMYKLSDSEGRLIAIRPDSTIPIARLTATKLRNEQMPLRLYYEQSVYRRQPEHRGRECEILQMGVEFIGEAGFSADTSMVVLAVKSLEAVYKGRFRVEIGHVGLYKRLMERLGGGEELKNRIHRYVSAKNYSALEDVLESALVTNEKADIKKTTELILRLPGLFGGAEALDEATALFEGYDDEIKGMLDYLARVLKEMADLGYQDSVMIDLGLVGQADYYSSLVFKGYGEGAGEPLLSGGRYDSLLSDFGEDLPATGFGINIDLLTEAALEDSANGLKSEEDGSYKARPLRIALAKGRLEEDFISLMEKAGYDMTPLREKGRKLIIGIDGLDGKDAIEIFLAKSPDVVTSVEHGVCDVGIVGKDTLLEHDGTYYEILDLELGKCRFALAAPSGSPVANGASPKVAASKYPSYAGSYFERLGLDVRIIRIEGSVELAPLLGLSDCIVDLVESGTTLRENGLEVVAWIRDISARMIVNVTGMKLRKREIEELAGRLKK